MVGIGAISKIQVRIGADIRPLTSALGVAKAQVKGFGSGIARVLPGTNFLAFGLSAAFAGIGIAALRSSAQVEKGLAEVSTLLDGSADAAEIFGDEVARLSIELAAQGGELEVAKGLYQAISAGISDAAEATALMEVAMRAATAGVSDTLSAVDVLTSVVNAYGLEADDATRISDILFTTVKKGKTTFGELSQFVGRLTAISAQAGVSFEEVGAAIATITISGQKTDEAVTALRQTIIAFLKPTTELQQVINSIAVAQGFASDEFLAAVDAVTDAEGAVVRANTEYDNQVRILGGLQGVYDVLNDSLRETEGQMDDLGDTMAINSLSIRELRLVARQEGRKLTKSELDDIDALQLANEELGVSRDRLRIKQDDAKESLDEFSKGVDTQKDAVKGAKDEIKASEKNVENLADGMEGLKASTGAFVLEEFGLQGALQAVTDEAGKDADTIAQLFGNIRALAAVLPLTGTGAETFEANLLLMEDAAGASDEAFEKMANTTSFKWTKAMNEAKVAVRELGDQMQLTFIPIIRDDVVPAIKAITGVIGEAIEGFNLLRERTAELRVSPESGQIGAFPVLPSIPLPGGRGGAPVGEGGTLTGEGITQFNTITVTNDISGSNLAAEEISRAVEEGIIRGTRSAGQ